MSIAVSAIVVPSRRLLLLTYGMCAAAVLAAGGALGLAEYLPQFFRICMVLVCIICTSFALFHLHRQRNTYRIDISGIGKINLTQYDSNLRIPCTQDSLADNAKTVQLLPRSSLWSSLMLLQLKADSGEMTTLRILPDSVTQQEFRALSVACRWIAARMNEIDSLMPSGKPGTLRQGQE